MRGARFLVSGRVQGVFFRASTRNEALRLGLDGYARNLSDGSVEVVACGSAEALAQLEQWLWQGPSAAHVEAVLRSEYDGSVQKGFAVT
ncbi:acylphosphatase [Dyella sp. 2HG41-7]|uniref:acylphosphatase n=1 Tax=Dyella sp. 2HG41-7 TaxID=2883239 RepID=UPI001F302ED9|nr:acylphosphatase [Dyella sp. 2HG41-7]